MYLYIQTNIYIYIAYIKRCALERGLLVHIHVKTSNNIINCLKPKENRPFRINFVLNLLPYAYVIWQLIWDHIIYNT